ncbi:uncharacterized protein LOC660229 [Tribolium castaneum]|uniref:uncharacterized protein LOC660229 n=1 Tax=Tribolium castaneum TaxID=7070 RepID=UPI0000D55C00|nr:PREDICTED: uncharacterized protein LOC660229 [Tribolium castaneum]|eukprot:XP_971572.1 PREDICTED: uncharacterized protein LOC660229 [Tribolium castaneum]
MKGIFVFLALLGLSFGAPNPQSLVAPRSLIDDFADFIKLLPVDDIKTIADKHLAEDGAFAAVITYLQGDEWAALVETIKNKPEVQDFVKYLTDAGLPVDEIVAWIHNLIANAVPGVEPDENGSLRPLLDEIEAILPVADLIALLNDKLQNSPDFQAFYVRISSENAHALVEEIRAIDEVQRLAQRLRDFGVKVDEVLAIVYDFLGWGKPKTGKSVQSLIDDFADFIKLLPVDDIKAIADKHLADDGTFAAVIIYLQGDEWAALVETIKNKPEVQDFVKYLTDAGLPVDEIVAWIHNLIANAVPGVDPDENGSLRPLLDEIEAILPVADLIALLNDKLQNSPDFQAFYVRISSENAHALVEEIRAIDEVQRLAQRLRDFGVKVDEVLAIVYDFLGWGKPKTGKSVESLIDDFADFIKLLPVDDIKAIADKHLANDGTFAAVIIYLQGDEWAALVETIKNKPEVQDFVKYLTDAGLPVDEIVAWIHNLIANAVPGVEPDENGSLRPLLDEIEAILPVADLIALLNDKLQNSPDFQAFYVRISSENAHALVEEIRAIDEVQRLAQRLRDFGVKVDEVLAIVYDFLGWGKPKTGKSVESLIDDFADFIKLLPVDDIKAIADKHLADDGTFAAVIIYLQGDEWAALVETIKNKPEVQDFVKYLTDAGLPVDEIVAWIHNLIANAVPGVEPDENGSLRPLLDEIEAILPVADLIALLNDKLQNSPDFQAFYVRISSENAHALVEEIRAIDEVQRLAQRLRDFGVKVDEVLAIVYDFLGWGKPKTGKSVESLIDDFADFIKLLPVDDIKAIADKHLADDGTFAAVIIYLQGDEWAALVETIKNKPEVQDFVKYLTDAGLPVDEIVAWIHNLIANAVPGVEPDENGSLRPLLDEIEAILPVADLIALLNDKLQNSPDFQAFYVRISSENAHALVEEIRAIDEVQRLAQRLRDFGVKVDEVLAIVYDFLGWGKPKTGKSVESLIDDFADFIKLLPVDDIKAIADKHLANDGTFAAVIIYLQGDEWAALVETIKNKPEVQDFVKYLTDAGLPVDEIVAWIHNLIANAVPGVEPDENGSLRPLLDEIEAILPVADLIALLNDKLQNSPDFQAFYVRISSENAHALVEEIRAIDEVQRLAQRLRDFGVKVDEVLAIVYDFLGWGKPKTGKSVESLIDDFADFIKLLPVDDIKAIADKHLADDGTFAAVIIYLQGDEWAALVETIKNKPEVQDFVKYLTDAGLPVDEIVAWIHNLIANAVPGVDPDENGSLRPLLDEIEAILPVADLIALLNDKLQNSPDFQAFYVRISSENAHALVEEIRAIDEVQRLAQRLRDFGVKVDEVLAIVYDFLGWGKPKTGKSVESLIDDFADFIKLLPVDDIKAIADKHLADDGTFAAVIIYLQGDEWAALVETIKNKPEVQDFVKYLTDAGLPVDEIVAWIHNLIANAVPGVEPDENGSLRPLLDEIEAILPVADLIALLNDKLQNSPDFQAFYVRISSENAHALVEEIRAIDEVQRLAQRLRDFGVKVDEVLAIVYDFLGWGKPKKF